jgi:magnesium-transporting ATPase (P-type)
MVAIVPMVLAVNKLAQRDWLRAGLFAMAAAVGPTPEMLPVVITSALARATTTIVDELDEETAPDFRAATLQVPIIHPPCSSSMLVFVKGAAESILSMDVQVQDLPWLGDRFGQRAQRSGLIQGLCLPKTSSAQVRRHVRIRGGCLQAGRVVGFGAGLCRLAQGSGWVVGAGVGRSRGPGGAGGRCCDTKSHVVSELVKEVRRMSKA